MKQQSHRFWTASGISLLYLAATSPTHAQIVPDVTLPVNSAVVTSEDNIKTINGGTVAGSNLFHSFNQFNIDEGQGAYFNSPSAAIQNILARVTGGSRSEIMGTLGTSGLSNPNLFLINPSGIIFGPKASLEVGGSFVATTANAIEFGNQGFFSTSAPNAPGLLTVNPSAFLFNQIATNPYIENKSIAPAGLDYSGLEGLWVPDGRSLLLVGGNVTLDNGQLHALGGRVELGGVAESGTLGLNIDGNNLHLSFPEGVARADVLLTNGAKVNVTAGGGGSVAINARNLDVLEASVLQAGIGEDLESDDSQPGDITLNATEAVTIAGSSRVFNNVGFGAVGNAGSILIKAESLSLADGAQLSAATFGQGEAGGISVQASKYVSIANSLITTGPDEGTGVGNGGDINIQTGDLSLTDGAQLDTSTSNEGRAGNVIIDARNTVSLQNSFISSETFEPGDAGIIDIKARALSLTEGAEILSRTTGAGNAGTIQIKASDSVSISGVNPDPKIAYSSGLITETLEENSGLGGNISVTTGSLRVSDGGVLSARTFNASSGGNITVNANTVEATYGGQLLTSTFSSGPAGSITVNATDSVTLSGSDPTYGNRLDQAYDPRIIDNDGPASGLLARVRGEEAANAGNIKVTARSIQLDNQGTLSAETTLGEGGSITLQARDILLRNNSSVTATAGTARAGGNGGNINIDSDLLAALENSDIIANAFEGRGGNVQINTQGLFLTPDSQITASSERGIDGVVEINTPDVDPSQGLVKLPAVPINTEVVQTCQPGGSQAQSEFIITGRGGLPPSPHDALSSDAIQVDWVTLNPGGEKHSTPAVSTTPTAPAPLVEAQGWVINNKGEVVLTAQVPTVTPHIPWMRSLTCHSSSTDSSQ